MHKWLIVYYRPLSGPAIQADIVSAKLPVPVYFELLAIEPLPGDWSQIEASAVEHGINRGLRFTLEH